MRSKKISQTLFFSLLGLAPLLLVWGWLSGQFQAWQQQDLNDGPYIFYQPAADQAFTADRNEDPPSPAAGQNRQLQVQWICQGQLLQTQQQLQQPVLPACGFNQPLQIRPPATALPAVKFSASKLAALSDIHGQYGLMLQLLQRHGVVDGQLQWQFGSGHLVIAGDVMDRGPQVTEILWFLYQLEQQALQTGGRVHLLLGNHETMVLRADLRYIHDKYRQVASLLGRSYQQLYSADSVLGDWLRSKPVLVQINDSVFLHAGLHPDYLALGLSMSAVNEHYRQGLGLSKSLLKQQPVLEFLYGSIGPLWYRGYFRAKDAIQSPALDQLLQQLQLRRIVVGHTSMDAVYSHWQGRVLSLDSSIKNGVGGELLLWQLPGMPADTFMRGTLDGQRLTLTEWQAGPAQH